MTGLEIILPILGTLGALVAYKGASKLKIKFGIKYNKRTIKRILKKSIKKGDWEKFQEALVKIKEYDLNHKTDKFAKYLEKYSIPEEIVNSIDKFGDFIEDKKDSLIELIEDSVESEKSSEENQMLTVIDEAIEKTFEIQFHRSAVLRDTIDNYTSDNLEELPRLLKRIHDLNLTELFDTLKHEIKESVKKEIPKELDLDKLFNNKMRQQMLRRAQLKKVANAKANIAMKSHGV